MSRVPFTHTWIESERILAGSIPQQIEDLEALKAQGITSILTLTRRDIATYPSAADWLNANSYFWTQRAIPDNGLSDDLTMFSAARYIAGSFKMGRPIYVHCRGGIGRTGTVLLAYYVLDRGMSLERAREMVRVRRNYEGNASAIDQGSPQREWIDSLESKRNQYWEMQE